MAIKELQQLLDIKIRQIQASERLPLDVAGQKAKQIVMNDPKYKPLITAAQQEAQNVNVQNVGQPIQTQKPTQQATPPVAPSGGGSWMMTMLQDAITGAIPQNYSSNSLDIMLSKVGFTPEELAQMTDEDKQIALDKIKSYEETMKAEPVLKAQTYLEQQRLAQQKKPYQPIRAGWYSNYIAPLQYGGINAIRTIENALTDKNISEKKKEIDKAYSEYYKKKYIFDKQQEEAKKRAATGYRPTKPTDLYSKVVDDVRSEFATIMSGLGGIIKEQNVNYPYVAGLVTNAAHGAYTSFADRGQAESILGFGVDTIWRPDLEEMSAKYTNMVPFFSKPISASTKLKKEYKAMLDYFDKTSGRQPDDKINSEIARKWYVNTVMPNLANKLSNAIGRLQKGVELVYDEKTGKTIEKKSNNNISIPDQLDKVLPLIVKDLEPINADEDYDPYSDGLIGNALIYIANNLNPEQEIYKTYITDWLHDRAEESENKKNKNKNK